MFNVSTIQARADELRAQHQKINDELSEIEAALRVFQRYAVTQSTIPTSKPIARSLLPERAPNKRIAIIGAVVKLLETNVSMHTLDIYQALADDGVEISDTKEKSLAQLSAYLSREKEAFTADRRRGWSLNKKPDNAPTLPGFSHG